MSSILNVKKSPLHGKGVFANRNISKGEIIVESHMVLIHVNENLPEKLATLQFPWTNEYEAICLSDAGSFFNHSKEPNAIIKDRDFENEIQIFSASKAINKGEEITIYYNDAFEKFIQ
ncbi:MAG: SET domain-containing protein-lysine N-methyltransferase [Flavobacteriales bacterium]|tara:strand:+ start:1554 stop:1907 length:354 start_codon:yes stop_codon:yes gene_type:complete